MSPSPGTWHYSQIAKGVNVTFYVQRAAYVEHGERRRLPWIIPAGHKAEDKGPQGKEVGTWGHVEALTESPHSSARTG